MKRLTILLAVFVALAALAACGDKKSGNTIVDTGVGKVSATDVVERMKQVPSAERVLNQVVQQLALEQMLQDKYDVSEKEVKAEIEQQKKQLPEGVKLEDLLKQNNLSKEEYKDVVKTNLLIKKARSQGVDLSEKEMKKYFEKHKENFIKIKAMHVLVEDKATAQKVYQKAKSGTDFAKLVEKYAIDQVKKNGGKLGWFGKGQMVQPFWEAAKKLEPGEISKPVKTKFGYHVIKVTDKKASFKKVKKQVKQQMIQEKGKSLQTVFNNMLKKYDIEVKDKAFKQIFQPKPSPKEAQQGSGQGGSDKKQ